MSGSNKFNEEAVRFICAEIGSALDFLRTKKIVHRDVKPDNILLDESGHAHLTDFNVAAKHNLPHGKILKLPQKFILTMPRPVDYTYILIKLIYHFRETSVINGWNKALHGT